MSALNQKTVKKTINFSGVGLHNGLKANISIKPSEPDTGIIFKRVDLKNNNLVLPNFSNVTDTSLNTTISNEYGVKISTIEHLMGALFGLGVDNAIVETFAPNSFSIVVFNEVLVTFRKFGYTKLLFFKSTLLKIIPVLGSEGLMQTFTE